jgi:hypothetical protein
MPQEIVKRHATNAIMSSAMRLSMPEPDTLPPHQRNAAQGMQHRSKESSSDEKESSSDQMKAAQIKGIQYRAGESRSGGKA